MWNNQWSTVCDDGWNDRDARVLCKQLGHPGGSAKRRAFYGQGTGVIMLNNVNCSGKELTIFECNQSKYGKNNCDHHEDAGVTCIPRGKGNYCLKAYIRTYVLLEI